MTHPADTIPPSGMDDRSHRRRTTVLGFVAAAGLVLAMAATGPQEPAAASGIAKHFLLELPEWLTATILALFGAAALLVLGLVLPRPRRRRKGEEPPDVHERPKVTPGTAVLLLLLALLPVCLAGAMFWLSYERMLSGAASQATVASRSERPPVQEPAMPLAPPERAIVRSPAASGILATLAVLAALAALGVMLWIYFGDRWRRRITPPGSLSSTIEAAAAESIDDLGTEADVRRAIIKCYARFERVLASAEFPRAVWQTPNEFMQAVLRKLRVPQDSVRELTRLFEIARFSRHPVDTKDREAAVQALVAIRTALQGRNADAVSA
jgi:hypothetical protein